ncbi:MAG: nucleotidyltransferase family protein, partial [Siphonobacter sp.]
MIYAIIAAGEGSRLAKGGFPLPKPMVRLQGEMLIDRLIGIFSRNQAEAVWIIINEHSPELEAHLNTIRYEVPIKIVRKSTPSSLHSFYELLKANSEVNALCLTTTDTVFKEAEFADYIKQFTTQQNSDGLMAVTSFIDDESPL